MPPEADDDSPAGDPVADAVAAVDAQLAQTPEAIRATPEFQALEKQLRKSAREKGTALAAAAKARQEAETYRQAAEASRQAALETEIGQLPPEAVTAYQELAELGQSDPVAAARRLAELMASGAQSAGQPPAPPATPPAPPEGTPVAPTTGTPPPPISSGVDGNQPLTQPPGEDITAITGRLDKRYSDIVERNQDPVTRNRVTMRERADGFISYLGSAYLKAIGHE